MRNSCSHSLTRRSWPDFDMMQKHMQPACRSVLQIISLWSEGAAVLNDSCFAPKSPGLENRQQCHSEQDINSRSRRRHNAMASPLPRLLQGQQQRAAQGAAALWLEQQK